MKGILFSYILLTIALTVVAIIAIQKSLVYFYGEKLAIETRINAMNNFYDTIVEDAPKALDIISKRAISSAVSYVFTNGVGLDQADLRLKELILNGTLNETEEALMKDSTFTVWIRKMEEIGDLNGFKTNITAKKFEVKAYDSFNILIETELQINITDEQGTASLRRNETVNQITSIESFEDPTYPLNTFGKVPPNVITRSSYWGNFTSNPIAATGDNSWFYGESVIILSSGNIGAVSDKNQKVLVTDNVAGIEATVNQFGAVVSEADIVGGITISFVDNTVAAMSILPNNTNLLVDGNNGKVWLIDNLKRSVEGSYYHPSLKGPSFLDRLEGKLEVQTKYQEQTTELIGLESFVDKNYIASYEVPVDEEKTNVDHLYFSLTSYPGQQVKGLGSTFRIDQELCTDGKSHTEIYEVNEILI